ncbi:MAG: fibronectin type III domain-containing protein [Chitinophagaceae bacterium]|nr:fibronectin type III domain-containing protein [Chitinophagaceae bacterium]
MKKPNTNVLAAIAFCGMIALLTIVGIRQSSIGPDTSSQASPEFRYPKQFMLEEMYKQWKEMLQDPQGQIPIGTGYRSWVAAGEMMRQQKQDLLLSSFASLNWTSRGPSNVGGRTRALLVSPNDATGNTVFAGSVGGGLWRSNNMKGSSPTWTPVNDFMENLSIATLAYDPSNTQVFYAGTGEGFNNADAARGYGILKSTDGGNTWSFLSSTQNSSFYYVNKLVVTSTGIIVAATSSGIRRSTDGGLTWANPLGGSLGDVEIAANGVLFAASKNAGGGVYRSTDNGATWTQSVSGLPTGLGGYSRYELATAPSDANRVYVMVYQDATSDETNFYKSVDGGATYTAITRPVDADGGISSSDITRSQGWYDLIIKVDPNNADVVYTGGIDLFKSTNGGGTWTQISHWYGGFSKQNVHADQHYIEFEGTNSSVIYFTNDGGVFQTTTGTNAVPTITARNTNYNVTQFYACAMHPASGSNFFIAGAQDNGTQRFTLAGFGSTSQASGGDGAYCNIDQLNPTYMFSQYVYNNYYRSTNGGSSFGSVSNSFSSTGRFINPTQYDDNTKELYAATAAGKYLRWNNANTGNTFEQVTVTALGTQAISAVTVSPVVADRVYFGTGNGQVVEVNNASTASGTVAGRSLGTPNGGYLNCIWQDPDNADHLMLVYSGFGRNNIYETWNASAATPSWTGKDGNLPDMPVFWILPEPGSSSTNVLVATEYGVWSTTTFNNTSPTWAITSNGMARVRVTQLHYRPSDHTVVASTHGRGLFTATLVPSNSCGLPSSLSSSAITATTATVSWGAVNGALSYDADYKLSSSSTWINAATGITATTLNLAGLNASATYDWRVRANCASASSSYVQAQFTTNPLCGNVGGLSATGITETAATLNWAAVSGADSYDVEYKTAVAATWTPAITGTTSLSHTLSNLTASTAYNWRVRSNCPEGAGSFTQANFSTLSPPVCTDTYEANNTSKQAKTISIGTPINAGIGSSTDVDWFKVSTGSGSSTNLKVTLSNLPADYDVYVYNKNLVQVAAGTATGNTSEVVIYNTTTTRATYYIKVQGKSGAFSISNCYSLLVQSSSSTWTGTISAANPAEFTATEGRITIYPNPVSSTLFLRFHSDADGEASLRLLNANGVVMQQQGINVMKGSNLARLDVQGNIPGVYLVQITNRNLHLTQKVMIVR